MLLRVSGGALMQTLDVQPRGPRCPGLLRFAYGLTNFLRFPHDLRAHQNAVRKAPGRVTGRPLVPELGRLKAHRAAGADISVPQTWHNGKIYRDRPEVPEQTRKVNWDA